MLLTEGFWKRRLGGDPGIVGKPMTINDNAFTVVGVLPESFAWGRGRLELFVPMAPDPARSRSDHRLGVIGRLKNNVTLDQATVDMNTIAQRLGDQYPESNKGWKVGTQSFFDWLVPKENRDSLVVILGAVVFLLLIACSNVANLLLARASSRDRRCVRAR